MLRTHSSRKKKKDGPQNYDKSKEKKASTRKKNKSSKPGSRRQYNNTHTRSDVVDSQSECDIVETVSVQDTVCHGDKQASDDVMAENQSNEQAARTERMSEWKFKGLHKLFRGKSKKESQRKSSNGKSREVRSPPGGKCESGRPSVDLVCKRDLISDSSTLSGIESVSDTSWQISELSEHISRNT